MGIAARLNCGRFGCAAENPLRVLLSAVVDRARQPRPRRAAQGPSSVPVEQDRSLRR